MGLESHNSGNLSWQNGNEFILIEHIDPMQIHQMTYVHYLSGTHPSISTRTEVDLSNDLLVSTRKIVELHS